MHVHMEVTKYESTKLCNIFLSGPNLRMHVHNLEGFIHLKREAKKSPIFSGFTKMLQLKHDCLWNRTHYRQREKGL